MFVKLSFSHCSVRHDTLQTVLQYLCRGSDKFWKDYVGEKLFEKLKIYVRERCALKIFIFLFYISRFISRYGKGN